MKVSRLSPWLALSLTACVAAPPVPPHIEPASPPASFDAKAANGTSAVSLDRWWAAWGDPTLDRLVEKAIAANPDIRTAQAHVAAARALVAVSESALYPSVSAYGAAWADLGNSKVSEPLATNIDPYSTGNLGYARLVGLGASWEPDIFGGRHADIAVARAIAESATHGAQGVRLTVIADVVENYQELQGLRRRLVILDGAIATSSRLSDYVAARMQAGQANAADVARAQNNLEALKAQRSPIVALIDARRRRLAVLAGDVPETAIALSDANLLTVPDAPSGQLPSSVLERRPDVRARGAIIKARAARVTSLKADLKPHFGIHFLGQNGHVELSGMPGYGGTDGLLGLTASVPIFTGGRLRANVAAGNAELEAAYAAYDRSLLSALEDVESAYGFRKGLDDRLVGLTSAQRLSTRRAEQMDALYAAGRVPLSDALQAHLEAFQDEDRTQQALTAQGTATVQLYRALGGGWAEPEGRSD